MRLAIDELDPGWANYQRLLFEHRGMQPEVRLDGEVISHVVLADEEQGLLERLQYSNGQYILNPECTDVMREQLHGVVRITWEPEQRVGCGNGM